MMVRIDPDGDVRKCTKCKQHYDTQCQHCKMWICKCVDTIELHTVGRCDGNKR